jgi:hypothetical protein
MLKQFYWYYRLMSVRYYHPFFRRVIHSNSFGINMALFVVDPVSNECPVMEIGGETGFVGDYPGIFDDIAEALTFSG